MSSNKKQLLDDNEIDLGSIIKLIWFNKYIVMLFLILSVPASIIYSMRLSPEYMAVTVFEKPASSHNEESISNSIPNGSFISLLGGNLSGQKDSFFSEIRSGSFLETVFLNNAKLNKQKFKELCPLPSGFVPQFSLRSLLVLVGLSENKIPSETQKISLLVKCVNDMLTVDNDTHDGLKTNAYKLSITSRDPSFSANLANQIVEKYFIRYQKNRDQKFQNVKKYLSRLVSEAQKEFTEASELIKTFIIKNTLPMNTRNFVIESDTSDVMSLNSRSPFAAHVSKEVGSLSQLEKSLSQIKQARLKLSNLQELDIETIKKLMAPTEVQGVLSRSFITYISKIDDLVSAGTFKDHDIKKLMDEELRSFEQQIQVLEKKIKQKEEQTIKLMNIENRYQELLIDASKKQIMFEGLKDQLQKKILLSGLDNLGEPILLTRATPPFNNVSPNKKLIVVFGALLSVFIAILYILMKQLFFKKIYSLSQVRQLGEFLGCYQINHKQLKQMSEGSGQTVISQSFFSNAKQLGKFGCVIDLSQKKVNNALSSTFTRAVANLLATENMKIVCLDTLRRRNPFFNNKYPGVVSNDKIDAESHLNRHIFSFSDEDGMIGSGKIGKIKERYSEYNKIICALGSEVTDLIKFNFIEQCDFYIVIGRSFRIDEVTFKKFSDAVWEKEKKCLGFFLID